jgi:hypothetical protein
MHKTLKTNKFLLAALLLLPALGSAQQRAAFGPVEHVRGGGSTLTVLGQTFRVTAATRIAVNGRATPLRRVLQHFTDSQAVYVEGMDSLDGSAASMVDVVLGQYVPGAMTVHATGPVAEISPEYGFIRIGALYIDTTASDPQQLASVQKGSLVYASGIQPSLSGRLVGPVRLSIGGSGTHLESIGGSGASLQSIGGSGTSLQSIGGSGKMSIGGSGSQLQSIGGSGTQLQSIGGSGSQLQSIGGSGAQSLSIGGSGMQLQSIGGSGSL